MAYRRRSPRACVYYEASMHRPACAWAQVGVPSRLERAFDVAGALAGLMVFSPILLLVSMGVLLEDGRPLLFRQERLGAGRRPFSILKVRTMRDGRITRMGRLLRATGLDEVPQLLNILGGHMSAVGPRPLTADDVRRLGWTTTAYDFRWDVRPGLTGLAQLAGAIGNDALALDRRYLEGWRPLLTCRLIALSFAVNVLGKSRIRRHVRRWLQRGNALESY